MTKQYCDTNILTAFINKDELRKNFGGWGVHRFQDIKRFRSINAEEKLKKIQGCKINRDVLFDDIRGHQASMGGVLTSINLKDVELINVDGLEEGKKIFNKSCSKSDRNSKFHKKFCKNGRLKDNLEKNELNDIKHFGSAIKSNCDEFITDNLKDFSPLKNFTKMEVG